MLEAKNYDPALALGAKILPQNLAVMAGLPVVGNVFYVDANNGSNTNGGKQWNDAFKTLKRAYDAALSNNYDLIIVAPGGTGGTAEGVAWTWSKNHITVMGGAAPTLFSPRSRVLWPTAGLSTSGALLTISGQGNRFINLQFASFVDNNILVKITNNRNYFSGVHFAGIGHADAGDDTAARCLLLSGAEENLFEDCTIGLDTVPRSVANAELELAAGATRNAFRGCRFVSFADDAAHLFVKAAAAADVDRLAIFERCLFHNAIKSTATAMTVAMDLHTSLGGTVLLYDSWLLGATDWADNFDNVEVAGGVQATAATAGLMITAA